MMWALALLALGTVTLASGCGTSSSHTSGSVSSEVARGAALYRADGCDGRHSLNGTRLAGPSWKALAGSKVALSDGRTVTADGDYLSRHIVEPNAMTIRGYTAGIMGQSIEGLDLKARPQDVRALVAFIESQR